MKGMMLFGVAFVVVVFAVVGMGCWMGRWLERQERLRKAISDYEGE